MSLTADDIDEIVRAAEPDSSKRGPRSRDLREFLASLGDYRFGPRRAPPLIMLCRAGVEHAWRRLEDELSTGLVLQLSPRAKASLKRHLEKTLERITRPTLHLEWRSFTLALSSLGFPGSESSVTIQMFLREKPAHRLGLLFKSFPVLAALWIVAIRQWRTHVSEILVRLRKDRPGIALLFPGTDLPAKIENLRLGLSDSHQKGRSVALIQFSRDRRVIYKPRPGTNELAWFSFLAWMNSAGFQPPLRLLRVLVRTNYCWMEFAEAAACSSAAAARRFYERLGGLIAAAYLWKAVDCHRENLIAAGEHPILIDVDALWHVSSRTTRQSVSDILYRTGFFPNARRRSLESRSSILGRTSRGAHLPRLGNRPVPPRPYAKAIISGFRRAWHCVLGNPGRRAAFAQQLELMLARERRWIFCATARYGKILRASVQPAVLQSEAEREAVIRRSCSRSEVSQAVIQAERTALRELNIPYFNRRSRQRMPPESNRPPAEAIRAIRQALEWANI